MVRWKYNDGGRELAGFKGSTGDCAARAVAIATGKPYREVYDEINEFAKRERTGKRKRSKSKARTGVYARTLKKYLETLGWEWTPTMKIGSGCTCHPSDFGPGVYILRMSRHFTTIVNGVIHDTYDPSRGDKRCVYGYWRQPKDKERIELGLY